MKKTDLLSLEVGFEKIDISSTDTEEVEYFGQLLLQKFGEDKLFGQKIKNGTYTAMYKFSVQLNTEDIILHKMDIKWWLFSIALQRGWMPFADVGSFTRTEE